MKIKIIFFFFVLAILCPKFSSSQVDCNATTLEAFFDCYGGQSAFSTHSVQALTTYIQAEDAINAGQYDVAKDLIENLFEKYPTGSDLWWQVFNAPNGANIGAPHAYYGLRMMEDIIAHGLNSDPVVDVKKANMKIVLIGCSQGIQPTTKAELQNGTGNFVVNKIQPKLKEDNYRIIKQSMDLFIKYVKAITYGKLDLNIDFVEMDSVCVPVKVTTTRPYLAYDNFEAVWDEFSQADKDTTDWFFFLHPSHVPEGPDFDNESFITGGMGADSKGGPLFLIDDKWVVRKPAHLGKGNYSDIERRIYLPQWFQHEFFHHLYRIYPELGLEVQGHDWFNRSFWPANFKGQYESDYYAESLRKKLQLDCTPLVNKLITRVQKGIQAEYAKLSVDEILGSYALDVVQNDWHEGDIISENGRYYWRNKANVRWEVQPDLLEGKLITGNDSPYPGQDFFLELYQSTEGNIFPAVVSLKYQGESYKKSLDLLRQNAPMEITLGQYARVPNKTTQHSGKVVKKNGNFFWENTAGDQWTLEGDLDVELFKLSADSPTPNENFELILVEDACGLYNLGFEYEGYYYWMSKRSESNKSPVLMLPTDDLQLSKNFGNYSVSLTDKFRDVEGDSLIYFVTSENPSLINAEIDNGTLRLSGTEEGNTTIYIMAVDANGGLAVDTLDVTVKNTVSTVDFSSLNNVKVFPSITQDVTYIINAKTQHTVSLFSVHNVVFQNLNISNNKTEINMAQLPSGIYFLHIFDRENGVKKVEKLIKQ